MQGNKVKTTWIFATFVCFILAVAAVIGGVQTARAELSASFSQSLSSSSSSSSNTANTSAAMIGGNYIINYIYEIDVGKSIPKITLNPNVVEQGSSLTVNGTNGFSSNSTVALSLFEARSLSLHTNNGNTTRSPALLMIPSNVTISQASTNGQSAVISNRSSLSSSSQGLAGTGTAFIATKILSSDLSAGNYQVDLVCASSSNSNHQVKFSSSDPMVVNGNQMKQYFKLVLPAGNYQNCHTQILTSPGGMMALQSQDMNMTVMSDSGSITASSSSTLTTDQVQTQTNGTYLQTVQVATNAMPGQYVIMADGATKSSNNNANTTINNSSIPTKAIAPLTITSAVNPSSVLSNTTLSQSVSSSSENSSVFSSSSFSSSAATSSTVQNDQGQQNSQPPNGNQSSGTGNSTGSSSNSTGTGGSGNSGGSSTSCIPTSSSYANIQNNENQVSSQSSNNNATNNAIITVVQKITGQPSGNGAHITNSVHVDNVNTVNQNISQTIHQNANIENCGWNTALPSSGITNNKDNMTASNPSNSIAMNATQNGSNIFVDDAMVIIEQTIIIPKSCETNVVSPVTVNNNNNVNQQVTQSINQNANIYYGNEGGVGASSSSSTNTAASATTSNYKNKVTDVSIQISNNTSVNKPLYNVNQVIIVPENCPATVTSPVVINNVNNITEKISQVTDQNATIFAGVKPQNVGVGGVTILSSVGVQGQQPSSLTNTVTMVAIQNATNSFVNIPNIKIQQSVYYVGNTTGWDQSNYEALLANEFGNSTNTNNSNNGINNSTSASRTGQSNSTIGSSLFSTSGGIQQNATMTANPSLGNQTSSAASTGPPQITNQTTGQSKFATGTGSGSAQGAANLGPAQNQSSSSSTGSGSPSEDSNNTSPTSPLPATTLSPPAASNNTTDTPTTTSTTTTTGSTQSSIPVANQAGTVVNSNSSTTASGNSSTGDTQASSTSSTSGGGNATAG